MSKIAVIYWSGTGNTEAMAKAVLKGAGVSAQLFGVSDFDADKLDAFDAFAPNESACPEAASSPFSYSDASRMILANTSNRLITAAPFS